MCVDCTNQELLDLIKGQQGRLNELESALKATSSISIISGSHPIIGLYDANDRANFDLTTGIGSGIFLGWSVCNGNTYLDNKGNNIATPQMVDKILVGAGNLYSVGDVSAPKITSAGSGISMTGLLYVMKIYSV